MKETISAYYLKPLDFAEFYLYENTEDLIKMPSTVLSKEFIEKVVHSEYDIRINWQDLVVGKIYYNAPDDDSMGRFVACKVLMPMVSIRKKYPQSPHKDPYYLEIFRKGDTYIVREYGKVSQTSKNLEDIVYYVKTNGQHFGSMNLDNEVRDTFANLD